MLHPILLQPDVKVAKSEGSILLLQQQKNCVDYTLWLKTPWQARVTLYSRYNLHEYDCSLELMYNYSYATILVKNAKKWTKQLDCVPNMCIIIYAYRVLYVAWKTVEHLLSK